MAEMMVTTLEEHASLTAALEKQLGARRYETHISTVLVANGKAWKIKKPLDLGFLDFSTLERRKFCCEEELRLNGRLADDVYQRVTPICGSIDAPTLGTGGEVIEYAVEMREFPADALLADHQHLLTVEAMDAIAGQIADFQKEITSATTGGEFGSPEAVLFPMQQNFDQVRQLIDDSDDHARLDVLNNWTIAQHQRHESLLVSRLENGFVAEGHGDMHLGNIAVEDGRFIIFDGIEFNPNLCWIDKVNEIAFFMMDLDRNGHHDLSARFLNSWLIHTGDYEGLALLRFYQVYRAMVRTKIAAFRLAQEISDEERDAVTQAYREYLSLAESYIVDEQPRLMITCGPSGSGKSVVARAVVAQLGAIQVASDVERKRLAGLAALESSNSEVDGGIYTSEMSQKTYQRLLQLSETIVKAGFIAVADATFLKHEYRDPFGELAGKLGVPFHILSMETGEEELVKRIEVRLARGDDPAEANVEVLRKQLESQETLDESEQTHAIILTPGDVEAGDYLKRL
ncbi:bifunctional aminoglycoside phosphotransferase/ATP-binding protein [Solemya velum gill symbiont]|uniref:Aminoglycoside phosphotransferase domain-containing protein n=2 Tax=Solemya velum gill symbiont TaxID=2340 RepID=A0A0B0H822_SOVGS|nr:bifunctional aminoglycoside phosphotransferase/ATP-binding protein [Solemya velum gill symbiont]KHF24014.1 hypothetical protein JV46_02100 [Solemya velum gill symbiont]OOY35830.1 hypothetical protein BOV88_01925 [Solemya velum gill symbiont]OOY38670.1 hypothetical protein BOV89_00095 [Solemya velum gill symbiont]OOY40336.1 hypothetical protein BOV90_04475 [Solemya velum gill symbiont]OOY44612.1 hypothetical protein BOV91_00895 [Solemya velum gill symbiont]